MPRYALHRFGKPARWRRMRTISLLAPPGNEVLSSQRALPSLFVTLPRARDRQMNAEGGAKPATGVHSESKYMVDFAPRQRDWNGRISQPFTHLSQRFADAQDRLSALPTANTTDDSQAVFHFSKVSDP